MDTIQKKLSIFSEQAKNTPTGFANMHTGFITYNNSKVLVVVAKSMIIEFRKLFRKLKVTTHQMS